MKEFESWKEAEETATFTYFRTERGATARKTQKDNTGSDSSVCAAKNPGTRTSVVNFLSSVICTISISVYLSISILYFYSYL